MAPVAGSPVSPPGAAPVRGRAGTVALVAAVLGVVAAAVVVATTTTSATLRLQVVDAASDTVVHEHAVEPGASLVLEHVHSVTRRPVRETFSVHEGPGLALEELWFDEFGPNLPAGAEHVGAHATFHREVDGYRVDHHGLDIGELPLMVGGDTVDHRITIDDDTTTALLDLVPGGTRVVLRVVPDGG